MGGLGYGCKEMGGWWFRSKDLIAGCWWKWCRSKVLNEEKQRKKIKEDREEYLVIGRCAKLQSELNGELKLLFSFTFIIKKNKTIQGLSHNIKH